jgi:hypothetical protein
MGSTGGRTSSFAGEKANAAAAAATWVAVRCPGRLAGAHRCCRPEAFDKKKVVIVKSVITTKDVNQRHLGFVMRVFIKNCVGISHGRLGGVTHF